MGRVSWEEWTEGNCGRDIVYEGRIYFQGRKGRKKGREGMREEGKKEIKYTSDNETLDSEVLWLLWAHLLSDTWPKLHLP